MTNIWKLQHWQKFEGLYVKKILKTEYCKVQGKFKKGRICFWIY
jgi:hypothetical protein